MSTPPTFSFRIEHLIRTRIANLRLVGEAMRLGRHHRSDFDDIRTYTMFVGHARSGHTLIKALLNAHRNVVLGQEVNILRFLALGLPRTFLYSLILARDQQFTRNNQQWGEYSYTVPNQWQGRFEKLLVIGDKKAAGSTMLLGSRPGLLGKLEKTVRVPVSIIHIVRNPYDNIATMSRKSGFSLAESVDQYFEHCETIEVLRRRYPSVAFHTLRFESFVSAPTDELARLCSFLEVPVDERYLADCSALVFESPRKGRNRIEWPRGLKAQVAARVENCSFTSGYTFEA